MKPALCNPGTVDVGGCGASPGSATDVEWILFLNCPLVLMQVIAPAQLAFRVYRRRSRAHGRVPCPFQNHLVPLVLLTEPLNGCVLFQCHKTTEESAKESRAGGQAVAPLLPSRPLAVHQLLILSQSPVFSG